MWLDDPIDVAAEFTAGLSFPRVHTLRIRDTEISSFARARVERTSTAVLYRLSSSTRTFTVRFEPAAQRWILESIVDTVSHC